MIAYLNGTVISKDDTFIVLEVNNVGYKVTLPQPLWQDLKENSEVALHIHTHVTEDSLSLYGFDTKEDLTFFKQLISVSGIGPRLAMGILASPIEVVKKAIFTEDLVKLSSFPGVGKKTAERLIVELKAKVKLESSVSIKETTIDINVEALEALVSLGYSQHEARKRLAKISSDVNTTEDLVREALRQ